MFYLYKLYRNIYFCRTLAIGVPYPQSRQIGCKSVIYKPSGVNLSSNPIFMSIFNNLFGNSGSSETPEANVNWNDLTTIGQLEEITQLSFEKPVIIFKHSHRCGISRMALKRFESEYNLNDEVTAYFLDLLSYRDVSNAVAQRFNIMHQSPQLLMIRNGKPVFDASHGEIDAAELKDIL